MKNDRLHACARAIRLALIVIRIEQKRRPNSKLGFTQINYSRLFVRDKWVLFAIARELNCSVEDLLSPPERRTDDKWSVTLGHAETLLTTVANLPAHLKALVVERANGDSWDLMRTRRPGRVVFSIAEDHSGAIGSIVRLCEREINYLATIELPKKLLQMGKKPAMSQAS